MSGTFPSQTTDRAAGTGWSGYMQRWATPTSTIASFAYSGTGNQRRLYVPLATASQAGTISATDYAALRALLRTHIQVTGNSNGAIAGGSFVTVVYNSEFNDTLNEYNTTTGTYTAAEAGTYAIAAYCAFTSKPDTIRHVVSLFINGSESRRLYDTASGAGSLNTGGGGALTVNLAASDAVTIRTLHNNGASLSLVTSAESSWLSITRL